MNWMEIISDCAAVSLCFGVFFYLDNKKVAKPECGARHEELDKKIDLILSNQDYTLARLDKIAEILMQTQTLQFPKEK